MQNTQTSNETSISTQSISGLGILPELGAVKKPSLLFNRSLLLLRYLLGIGLIFAGCLLAVLIIVELLDVFQNFQTHKISSAMLSWLDHQELFSISDTRNSFVLGKAGALIIVFLCLLLLCLLFLNCVFNLVRYGVQLLEYRKEMNPETDPEKEMLLRTLYTQSLQLEKLVSKLSGTSYKDENE